MKKVAIATIGASVLALLMAGILVLLGEESVLGIRTGAEGFSRASSNLSLIAIALGVWFKGVSED